MKVFFSLTLLIAMTLAEPPSYRQQSQRDRNTYYFAKQQEAEAPEADAPYPASGWKPDGPAFELPQKQQQQPAAPQQQYGAPVKAPQRQYGSPAKSQQQYRAPATSQQQYGAPEVPQQQYGTPAAPQQQYGAPVAPPQQYGAPAVPQHQYGPPQPTTTEPPTVTYYEESTYPTSTESQAEPVDSVNELDEVGDVDGQQRQTGEYYIALPDGRLQRVQYISSQNLEAMKYFAKIRAENVEPLRGPIYNYQPLQKLQFAPAQLQVAIEEPIVAAPIVPARESGSRSQKIQTPAAVPAKLEVQPLAAQVGAVPLTSSSFTGYAANYQTAPATEQRYLVTF